METFDADKINKVLFDTLANEIEEMCKKADRIAESGVTEGIKVIDPDLGIRILESDDSKFDALVRLQEILKFKDVKENELYEFPGMKIKDTNMTLYIPMSKVEKVAEMGEYFERELSDMRLKFPTQIYQFKKENKGKNLPGKDFPPPLPKTKEMTNDQYEKYLEEYYKDHGVTREKDATSFRRPYPHEKIDYQEGNKEKEGFTNEYYSEELQKHAAGKGTTTPAPVGRRIKVTAKSKKRPNIFNTEDKVETERNWSKVASFVLKVAAVGAGVAIGTYAIVQYPGLIALGAVGLGVAVGKYLKKKYDQKKAIEREKERERRKKERGIEEPGKGKEKEKEKEKGTGPGMTPSTTPTPVPGTTPGTTPGTVPGTTPGTTPTPVPGTSPGTTPGTNPGTTPGTTPRTVNPTPSTPIDNDNLIIAEEELGMDQEEFARLDREIAMIVSEVQILLRSTDPSDKDHLRELQEALAVKYNERMAIIYKLMSRQEKMLDDIGIKLGR